MKLRIVGHPEAQMRRRGITRADVEHALEHHHTRIETSRKNSITYIGPGVGGEDLKVWVLPPGLDGGGTIIVKSAAWKGRGDPT